jgi:hypothetical protein
MRCDAGLADLGSELVRGFARGVVVDEDIRANVRECTHDRGPDALGSTGDESVSAAKFHGPRLVSAPDGVDTSTP